MTTALTQLASVQEAASDSAGTLVLAPTSEWKHREYADKCRVSRVFGEGENSTTLWIDQGGSEPTYTMTLIGRPLRDAYGPAVRVQFGEEAESLRSYIRAKSSKGRPVLTMYGVVLAPPKIERSSDAEVEELSAERLEAITRLRLARSVRQPIAIELDGMAAPLLRLRACAEQLSIALARASSSQQGKARPPELEGGSQLAKKIRWPAYLLRAGMEGQLDFRLTVNAKGRPTNCHVMASNRPQLFDDEVCLGLLKHARFKPALDADGAPAASYYRSGITFRIK